MQSYQISDVAAIYNCDCMDVSSAWLDCWAVVTDPPYGMSYKSNHNTNGNRGFLRKDGNFSSIHGDDAPFDPSPWMRFEFVCMFGAQFFADRLPASRGWLVWDKLAGKSPCSQSDCELAWTNSDRPVRMFTHLWRGIMRAGEENVSRSRKLHPHQKPVALIMWAIEQMKIPKDRTVVDPYMGSGTVGVACMRLGYRYIGVEIDRAHYETARDRLKREAAQRRLTI